MMRCRGMLLKHYLFFRRHALQDRICNVTTTFESRHYASRYLETLQDVQKFAACFHLIAPPPAALVIDGLTDFLAASRYARNAMTARCLDLRAIVLQFWGGCQPRWSSTVIRAFWWLRGMPVQLTWYYYWVLLLENASCSCST